MRRRSLAHLRGGSGISIVAIWAHIGSELLRLPRNCLICRQRTGAASLGDAIVLSAEDVKTSHERELERNGTER
jgi:hypothetical protein